MCAWNPNDPCFDWKRPCFVGLTFKNRGHLGSRCLLECSPKTNIYNFFTDKFLSRRQVRETTSLRPVPVPVRARELGVDADLGHVYTPGN